MFYLSPAARAPLFRREIDGQRAAGRGMKPFDIQLASDWDGRDAEGRIGRFPVIPRGLRVDEK